MCSCRGCAHKTYASKIVSQVSGYRKQPPQREHEYVICFQKWVEHLPPSLFCRLRSLVIRHWLDDSAEHLLLAPPLLALQLTYFEQSVADATAGAALQLLRLQQRLVGRDQVSALNQQLSAPEVRLGALGLALKCLGDESLAIVEWIYLHITIVISNRGDRNPELAMFQDAGHKIQLHWNLHSMSHFAVAVHKIKHLRFIEASVKKGTAIASQGKVPLPSAEMFIACSLVCFSRFQSLFKDITAHVVLPWFGCARVSGGGSR
mmetsp:Transcript_25387/g.53100  ORF Transcript_25387/g.53100 Transcript_25387/m.53100 type:complete len:262 (-) Transcript_25387:209-994(-)